LKELTPPDGYNIDDHVEYVILDTEVYSVDVTDPWVNSLGRIVETGTTCEQYLARTASIDLTEVIYRVKKDLINNTAPGVFFYYTTFLAPGSDFTVEVDQIVTTPIENETFKDFVVQNASNIRLFNVINGDCTLPSASYTVETDFENDPGKAVVNIQGAVADQVFIMSVKYETGSVVGLKPLPSPEPPAKYATIQYDFNTVIGEGESKTIVDKDSDGVKLVPR
jgi:hypothetical protein